MALFKRSESLTLSIPGINCGHCEKKVEAALSAVDGVKKVRADAQKKSAVVDLKAGTVLTDETKAEMQRLLAEAGYPVEA